MKNVTLSPVSYSYSPCALVKPPFPLGLVRYPIPATALSKNTPVKAGVEELLAALEDAGDELAGAELAGADELASSELLLADESATELASLDEAGVELGATEDAGVELTSTDELASIEELVSVELDEDIATELAATELGATLLAGADDLLPPPLPPPPQATRLITMADKSPC